MNYPFNKSLYTNVSSINHICLQSNLEQNKNEQVNMSEVKY